jgi:hypothetical protein
VGLVRASSAESGAARAVLTSTTPYMTNPGRGPGFVKADLAHALRVALTATPVYRPMADRASDQMGDIHSLGRSTKGKV